jgi:hypothetical protein
MGITSILGGEKWGKVDEAARSPAEANLENRRELRSHACREVVSTALISLLRDYCPSLF